VESELRREQMTTDGGAGSVVPVSNTATAEVNAPRMVTLYGRLTGEEYGTYPEAKANDMMRENRNLTPVRYDLDAAEGAYFEALMVQEAVARKVVEDRKRLGYVPEASEASWNLAAGQLQQAYRQLALALGALLPSEAEVRDWAAHQAAVGTMTKTVIPTAEGFREEDVRLDDLSAYPNHVRAAKHRAAIDAYIAEHGGQ
jgi:hypothetical protein